MILEDAYGRRTRQTGHDLFTVTFCIARLYSAHRHSSLSQTERIKRLQ
jgi:hypothetical protein